MRRLLVLAVMILPLLPARADALTVAEVIDLKRAGLSDEILLALIEVDARVYSIDKATLKQLKDAGISERVIVAMIRSGRTQPVQAAAPVPAAPVEAPPPQVVVIEHEQPVVQEVAVPIAVPVYVPVVTHVRSRHRARVPFNPAVPPVVPTIGLDAIPESVQRQKAPEPVYWGWGGKLRPDAWKPAKH
jgi:hypothetical protein